MLNTTSLGEYLSNADIESLFDKTDIPNDLDRSILVKYSDQAIKDSRCYARKPFYFVRGKPISVEAAKEIIWRTDDYFCRARYLSKDQMTGFDYMKYINNLGVSYDDVEQMYPSAIAVNRWFTPGKQITFGWCHPDGFIGTNNYSHISYPGIKRIICEMLNVGDRVKEFDLVFVMLDESYYIDKTKPLWEQIQTGIRIKEGVVEILSAAKARILLKQYDRKYADGTLFSDADFDDKSKKTSFLYYKDDANAEDGDINNKELLLELCEKWKRGEF